MQDDSPSELNPPERSFLRRWGLLAAAAALALVVFAAFLLLSGDSSSPTTHRGGGPAQTVESGVEAARQSLARQTDLDACRAALGQINSELSEKSQSHVPPLPAVQRDWLRQHADIKDNEFAEIESSTFTQLDGQHLDRCFLLRDAAATLEVRGVRREVGGEPVQETGLERAEHAFAWVMRQVRLREPGGLPAPPAFVLRRGWGTSLERALVFLALLEQIGDPAAPSPELIGCMVSVPGKSNQKSFWVCGVLIGDSKEIYLFDPRLGMPLPGPNGQGIATLSQAAKQPDVLGQLQVDKHRYDVTTEQARQAQARIFCSLSSLSPRMRYLQDRLLSPMVHVRLAVDPEHGLQRLRAGGLGEKPDQVDVSRQSIRLLRHFLTADEGGVDKGQPIPLAALRGFTLPNDPTERVVPQRQLFLWQMVPWTSLPAPFQDYNRFPYRIEMGMRVRQLFATPFLKSTMEPGQARDLLLRGHYSKASQGLVQERDRWRTQQQRSSDLAELGPQLDAWVKEAFSEYAEQAKAKSAEDRQAVDRRIRMLWSSKQSEPIHALLSHAIAEALLPEISYQLGLCSQELAEELQRRLDLHARASKIPPSKSEVEQTKRRWQNAQIAWKQYLEDYPRHRDAAAARCLRSRAEIMLGNRKAAAALEKDLSGEMSELEKLAALFRAKQIEKK